MKTLKFILLINFILLTGQTYAQQIVSDPGVTSKIASLFAQAKQMEKNLSSTLREIDAKNEQIRKYSEINENSLWEVPSYIKNGPAMNGIFDKEVQIIRSIQDVIRVAKNSRYVNFNQINGQLKGYMSVIGKLVDQASLIGTNNQYRMQPQEREKMLGDINSQLSGIQSNVTNLNHDIKQFIKFKKDSDKHYDSYKKLMKK